MALSNNRNGTDQVVNDPSSQLFSSLAEFYRENGLMSEAIEICLTGLEASPDSLEGRMVLARCYLATRELAKSREQITKVLTSQPENSAAKRLLAEVDREEKMAPGASAPPAAATPQPAVSTAVPAPQLQPTAPPEPQPPVPAATTYPALLAEVLAAPEPQPNSLDQARDRPAQAPKPSPAQPPLVSPAQPTPAKLQYLPPEPPQPAAISRLAAEQPQPQPAPPAAAPAASPAPAERPPEKGLQSNYAKILQDLVQTPQVMGSLLMDESGFVVASAFDTKAQASVDEESSGALAVSIFNTGRDAMKKIRMGELERLVLDTSTEKIFLNRAGSMLLLVSAETSAKVGLVAVNTRQAVDRIKGMGSK